MHYSTFESPNVKLNMANNVADNVANNVANNLNSNLNNQDTANLVNKSRTVLMFAFIMYFVVLFVFFCIAKVLWNKVGCKYITILKPVNSVVDIICLSIFFSIMRLL